MSRYDSFFNHSQEVPETYFQAAVFINRAYFHVLAAHPEHEISYPTRRLLNDTHELINVEIRNRSEYVSTYRGD